MHELTLTLLVQFPHIVPVITPAVPQGEALIRTSYMATHRRPHLDRALEALAKVGRELGVI